MKKILAMVLCTVMLLALCACNSTMTSTSTESYNGITKTTTTTTTNGKETVEITYTDAQGNTMDATAGEAAFEAAKAGLEGTAETTEGTMEEIETPASEKAVEAADSSAVKKSAGKRSVSNHEAVLTICNDLTDLDIGEMYIAFSEDTTWGDDILANDGGLEAGYYIKFGQHVYYSDTDSFDIKVVFTDGQEATFTGVSFTACSDPTSVTIRVDVDSDGYFTLYLS